MKNFVFGTNEQFAKMESILQDGMCHVYNGCELPDSCTPKCARLGFEKNSRGHYIIYIDKGVRTSSTDQCFKSFLDNGEIKFVCMDDMVAFLGSLKPLFDEKRVADTKGAKRATVSEQGADQTRAAGSVYDREKVQQIRAQTEKEKLVWPEEIAAELKKKVFGQDDVINEIANKVVINRMCKEKKLLAMALIGPTATGKSETAKSLAQVLSDKYSTPYGYIEIAGSEFVGEHTVHRFFGAPPGYVGHGNDTILEPVRKNPRHVIVINEIEKADTKLLTGLMEAIDTGMVGMADNSKPININQCIMLFTSNIPIDMDKYNAMSRFERAELCRDAFTKLCGRPEISGKIGNFIVFNPLSDEATIDIVVKCIREELENYDLTLIKIDDRLLVDFLNRYKTKYGARAIRVQVRDSLGQHLLSERRLEQLRDKSVSLTGTIDNIIFEIA